MMRNRAQALATIFGLFAWGVGPATAHQATMPAKKTGKIEPVAVVGCLQETQRDQWVLVNASEPVPSNANAPSAKELAALPKGGKRKFQLIGVTVFNLAAHRGHTIAVKGLPIPGSPADRLNVTSVTMIAADCPAGPAFY